jgi:phosphoglycerate dehydrogenase-like enzyme
LLSKEPLRAKSAFRAPPMLIPPHTAGETERYPQNVSDILAYNIERLLRADPHCETNRCDGRPPA